MERFRQDNTEGYGPADLAEMNRRFDALIIISAIPKDDPMRKSFEDSAAEQVQFAFDRERA